MRDTSGFSFEWNARAQAPERMKLRLTRREPPETSRRGSERRKRSQRNFFPTQKQIQHRGDLSFSPPREKKAPSTDALFLFDLRLVQSQRLTSRAVRADHRSQSMPYFSCSNALFFVLDASSSVAPDRATRGGRRETRCERTLVLLGNAQRRDHITREEELFCFFFFFSPPPKRCSKFWSSLSLSVQKRCSSLLVGFRTRLLSESVSESLFFLRRVGEIGSEM